MSLEEKQAVERLKALGAGHGEKKNEISSAILRENLCALSEKWI